MAVIAVALHELHCLSVVCREALGCLAIEAFGLLVKSKHALESAHYHCL
jgi:hypothetical protein